MRTLYQPHVQTKHNIPHLLQIVDEDHVEGLVPAAVQQEVEAIHL